MSKRNEDQLNKKYEPLPGEFVYKNISLCSWNKLEFIKRVENDDMFYDDDVILATYPKSGTTVVQEIMWLINNNIDIAKAKEFNIICRFPFIDENFEHNFPNINYRGYIINALDKLKRPRLLKTHLLFRNLESQMNRNPEMKVVTCFRNPKDTAVSMYHFYIGLSEYGPYKGSWDDFFERWIDGCIAGGDWLEVVTEWWSQRHRKNVKILFFEEIVKNKQNVILDLSVFFKKDINDDNIQKIVRHTTFKQMKENPTTNYENVEGFINGFIFMRKGEVGDWKNYFSKEQSKRLDDKYGPVLEECGLTFQYD